MGSPDTQLELQRENNAFGEVRALQLRNAVKSAWREDVLAARVLHGLGDDAIGLVGDKARISSMLFEISVAGRTARGKP